MTYAREELLSFLLRHAPRHGDDESGMRTLQRCELSDLASQLLLGLLADAARVEYDKVGLVWGGRGNTACCAKDVLHSAGVVHVHLAAEGLDDVTEAHEVPAIYHTWPCPLAVARRGLRLRRPLRRGGGAG
jgi:hypothetical protein